MLALRSRSTTGRAMASGFTLLELLVVVLIIGLAIGLVTFDGSDDNSAYKLKQELRFFANTMSLLAEEASLAGEQRGVDFFWDNVDGQEVYGYRWLRLEEPEEPAELLQDVGAGEGMATVEVEQGQTAKEAQWQPYQPADFDAEHWFPAGYLLRVEVEGAELEITEKLIPKENSALATETLQPDVWLFSSGEITPFDLILEDSRDPENFQQIQVDMLGRIKLNAEQE